MDGCIMDPMDALYYFAHFTLFHDITTTKNKGDTGEIW